MTPTDEQLVCIEKAREGENNLIISALAGAAKTTTLVMMAEAISNPILCLAFNKRIQLEMQSRFPEHCTALTLNGLGHRIWADTIGRRLTLEKDKVFTYLKYLVNELPFYDRASAYELFPETLKAIEAGKTSGYIPSGHYPQAKPLLGDEEFFAGLDEEPTDLQMDLIQKVTLNSLKQGMAGVVDFNDQILLPTVFQSFIPSYPLVLVDEAQDLSLLNHTFLAKLAKHRLIAVGDERQAIYGFRGAHENSMAALKQQFTMEELTLSISFRCPRAVAEEARWRAPHIRSPEWAKEGAVQTLTDWGIKDLPLDSAIICRNNAPLFGMAIKLLKSGRAVELYGNDIGKYLIRVMTKFGDDSMSQTDAIRALRDWEEKKLRKSRDPEKIQDQVACIQLFLDHGETLRQAIAYAKHLFDATGPVKLMTGHKSKGFEFPHVFILDRHLIRDYGQDRNLLYVMQTRAQETLTYVNSENFL